MRAPPPPELGHTCSLPCPQQCPLKLSHCPLLRLPAHAGCRREPAHSLPCPPSPSLGWLPPLGLLASLPSPSTQTHSQHVGTRV